MCFLPRWFHEAIIPKTPLNPQFSFMDMTNAFYIQVPPPDTIHSPRPLNGLPVFLCMQRNRIAFFASLIMLSFAMIICRDMFLFAKFIRLTEWSKSLPFLFKLPSVDMVIICLLPVALFTDSFSFAFASVVICVLLSPLVPVITWMTTISYHPLVNGIYNYLFIVLFHCAFPALLVLFYSLNNQIYSEKMPTVK